MADDQVAEVEERVKVSVRLESIDSSLRQLLIAVARLVALGELREAREAELVQIEKDRRKASAEAEHDRVEAEIRERETRGAWLRGLVDKVATPVGGALTAATIGVIGVATAWISGLFGRSP